MERSYAPDRGHAAATTSVVRALRADLRADNVLGALTRLNARTRFRFTGLYHADPPVLRNVYLVDRENPTLNVSGEIRPLDETYCAITYADEATFVTSDAARDARIAAHPARASILSYAGIPLRLDTGCVWGTLCHFDLRPRFLAPSELALLDKTERLFVEWLREHGRIS
jgi:GAF domain-containing protein